MPPGRPRARLRGPCFPRSRPAPLPKPACCAAPRLPCSQARRACRVLQCLDPVCAPVCMRLLKTPFAAGLSPSLAGLRFFTSITTLPHLRGGADGAPAVLVPIERRSIVGVSVRSIPTPSTAGRTCAANMPPARWLIAAAAARRATAPPTPPPNRTHSMLSLVCRPPRFVLSRCACSQRGSKPLQLRKTAAGPSGPLALSLRSAS